MLYFDDILRVEGTPVEKTKLARHSSTTGIGAYRLWKLDRPRFEKYQALSRASEPSVSYRVADGAVRPNGGLVEAAYWF